MNQFWIIFLFVVEPVKNKKKYGWFDKKITHQNWWHYFIMLYDMKTFFQKRMLSELSLSFLFVLFWLSSHSWFQWIQGTKSRYSSNGMIENYFKSICAFTNKKINWINIQHTLKMNVSIKYEYPWWWWW